MVMKRCVVISILWLAFCWTQASVTAAEQNSISVFAGGDAYQGAPVMTLRADGRVIGSVAVRNAVIMIPAEERTEEFMSASLRPYVFIVPSLEDVRVLRIEFSNDKWSGSAATGDRNLWIGPVIAGDTTVAPTQSTLAQQGVGRYGSVTILAMNGGLDFNRPKAGWKLAKASAEEPAAKEPAAKEPAAKEPAAKEAAAKEPAAKESAAKEPAAKNLALKEPAAKEASCAGKSSIVLSDYGTNQTSLSEADASQLTNSFAKIRGLSRCRLTISVMTSPSGTPEVNAIIAILRADAVLSLAVKAGAARNRIAIAPPKSGKRSVTISVSP